MTTPDTIVEAIKLTLEESKRKAEFEGAVGNHELAGILYTSCYVLQVLLNNIKSMEDNK